MTRFAYSVFCDDIRNEVNGKHSLMGVLGSLMYLPDFPAVLPKLCAVLTACTPFDQPFKSVSFKGTMDGNELFEIGLNSDQIDQLLKQNGGLVDNPTRFDAKAIVILSPLHVARATNIKVTVIADGEEIECNGIQISKAPEGFEIV